jgi:hypothetical protein
MKYDQQLNFHIKIILSGRIDYLNFKNEKKQSETHRSSELRLT